MGNELSTATGDSGKSGNHAPRIQKAFDRAWSLVPSRAGGYLALLLGWAGVWVVLELLVFSLGGGPWRPVWLLLHLGYFWGTSYWEAAGLRYTLESVRGGHPRVGSVFPSHGTALRFFGLKAMLVPATILGTAFIILPGSWLAARYGFSAFILIDRDCRIEEALSRSARYTRPYTARLMMLSIAVLLFNLLGAAVLGLGLLITVPVTTLAAGHVFQGLDTGDTDRAP